MMSESAPETIYLCSVPTETQLTSFLDEVRPLLSDRPLPEDSAPGIPFPLYSPAQRGVLDPLQEGTLGSPAAYMIPIISKNRPIAAMEIEGSPTGPTRGVFHTDTEAYDEYMSARGLTLAAVGDTADVYAVEGVWTAVVAVKRGSVAATFIRYRGGAITDEADPPSDVSEAVEEGRTYVGPEATAALNRVFKTVEANRLIFVEPSPKLP